MKVRILLSFLVATSIFVTACQQKDIATSPSSTTQNGQTISNNVEVNDFKFTKVAQSDLAKYNNFVSQNAQAIQNKNEVALAPQPSASVAPSMASSSGGYDGSTSSVAMPMPSGSAYPSSYAGGAYSDMSRSAFPMSYFPYSGPFEEYTVVDFEEAKSGGFVGSYSDIITKVIKPVIKNLASDARMTYVNGNLDANGLNKNEPQPTGYPTATPSNIPTSIYSGSPISNYYYSQYQWTFTFVSSANKEVYNFYISSESTLILKQKWGLKDLSYDNVKIDSSQAIKIVTEAIKNKAVATTNQDISYMGSNTEFIYDLPKNINWYLFLEKEKDALIWNINLNINYSYPNYPVMPMYDVVTSSNEGVSSGSSGSSSDVYSPIAPIDTPPNVKPTQAPIEYWYSGAYARVDASTGKILQFTRPTRTKYEPYPMYTAYPVPVPYETYRPSTEPTAMPSPEVKPTPVITN